ncbi:MAG: tRNA-dihydrouridine synthase [Patescibacteria group bacterium]|nr:tRNA-dihydrouridine synthase [Patescibacteria group bacterium]
MQNFWEILPKPFFCLAPLANVTDAAFRQLIAKYSKPVGPSVFYTEFVSADGLCLANEEGRKKLMRDLVFSEGEHPIVAQFFTATPEHMEKAAAIAQELGFDGVDINMGCPDRTIEKQGAGAKLMLNPKLAQELIAAAKHGAPELPISIKTRLGYNKDILDEWLSALLEAAPAAIAIHARTRKEMSKVPAHWDRVKRAVEIRNSLQSKTLIIGNGDVKDLEDARTKAEESGADGIMLGRAIFGTPWLFATEDAASEPITRFAHGSDSSTTPSSAKIINRLSIAVEHTKLFEKLLGDIKNFAIMKKHFKAYVEGFPGAKELRVELMEAKNAAEIEEKIERFLKQ